MDYSAISTAVNFGTVLTALGTTAVAVAGLYLAIRGARVLIGLIRR